MNLLESTITNEFKKNETFDSIFSKFEIPELNGITGELELIYKSNEYMGYYKKELYFNLEPKTKIENCMGTLKLTFVSSVKDFDIEKAMHRSNTNETHTISVTFTLHNEGNSWDTERYNYTLWKK